MLRRHGFAINRVYPLPDQAVDTHDAARELLSPDVVIRLPSAGV
jgi:hypothetical protein